VKSTLPGTSTWDLGARVLRSVELILVDLAASIAPGLRLPRILGGHLVRSDTQADLLYVLALLIRSGFQEVAGVELRSRAFELLTQLDATDVEGFSSYRVAESIAMLGGLSELQATIEQEAVRSFNAQRLIRDVVDFPGRRSPNFVVVAARCAHAFAQLGIRTEELDESVVRTRAAQLFQNSSRGWINDGRLGHLEFDIYTPEMYLLAEPFRSDVGTNWQAGLHSVLVDLEKLAQPGGAVTWGRSVGVLANAMTLELAAISHAHGLGGNRNWWLCGADDAVTDLARWFRNGLITSHQWRSTDRYRGPARRLQLTFDVLGKMAWSGQRLLEVDEKTFFKEPWTEVDEVVEFESRTGIWAHRSRSISFVLPLMAGRSAEYLSSPRNPGVFEQPVDGHPLFVPTVSIPQQSLYDQVKLVPAGPPVEFSHQARCLTVTFNGWVPIGAPTSARKVEGSRRAVYKVVGRSLEVEERLKIDDLPPGAVVSLSVGDVDQRPLNLKVSEKLSKPLIVETRGVSEWWTQWGEVARVHEIEFDATSTEIRFHWSVTPNVVVATTDPNHPYNCSLYGSMPEVSVITAGEPDLDLARRLRSVDILHIAWPERWVGLDPDDSQRVIEVLKTAGVHIVWTQHNLAPHRDRSPAALRTYALWAAASDAVIHHSHHGKRVAEATYNYAKAQHFVIPHGHWGAEFSAHPRSREAVEEYEGWGATPIRLAIIGQPRYEKDLQSVVDAVSACNRSDIQLVARLSSAIRVPTDRRIIANYGHVERSRYYSRLSAVDGIILPFLGDTMLTTGTAFDCIGGGIAPITTNWEFLEETFGDAAICYGESKADLVSCLLSLTPERLRSSGMATGALRGNHEWVSIGQLTTQVFETVLERKG
jgi:hypothetical protein